jgi:hypothetical protein
MRLWFSEQHLDVEDRTDMYLVFPACESVGLKLRNAGQTSKAKIEVKALRSSPEVVRYAADVVGRTDAWVKWTHPTNDIPDWINSIVAAETSWVRTRKRRIIRKYSLVTGDPHEIQADDWVPCGCSVELVALDVVDDQPWWTFGFESWGQPHDVREHLRKTAEEWFNVQGTPPIRLEAIGSVAYPTWAAGLAEPLSD